MANYFLRPAARKIELLPMGTKEMSRFLQSAFRAPRKIPLAKSLRI
jgi:hypothetical protein